MKLVQLVESSERKATLIMLDAPKNQRRLPVIIQTDENGKETLINRQFDIEIELSKQSQNGPTIRKESNTLYREI